MDLSFLSSLVSSDAMSMKWFETLGGWGNFSRILDVLLVSFLIYKLLVFVRGTRALPMIGGLTFLLVLFWIASKLSLVSLKWILGHFLGSVILVIVVLFQDDLRRALTKVGLFPGFGIDDSEDYEHTMRSIAKAAAALASKRMGAIIVLRREVGLDEYTEHAVSVDAFVSHQLLMSLFVPLSPLHDGAVVISDNRISVAGAVLPLSFSPRVASNLGTRHRAAIGLSEVTDALCVVVSEERGSISLVREGKIYQGLDEKSVFNELVFYAALHKRHFRKIRREKLRPQEYTRNDNDEVLGFEHPVSDGKNDYNNE